MKVLMILKQIAMKFGACLGIYNNYWLSCSENRETTGLGGRPDKMDERLNWKSLGVGLLNLDSADGLKGFRAFLSIKWLSRLEIVAMEKVAGRPPSWEKEGTEICY